MMYRIFFEDGSLVLFQPNIALLLIYPFFSSGGGVDEEWHEQDHYLIPRKLFYINI